MWEDFLGFLLGAFIGALQVGYCTWVKEQLDDGLGFVVSSVTGVVQKSGSKVSSVE